MTTERDLQDRADELRAERARLLREARQLLDTAQKAGRDLTGDELTRWRGWLNRCNEIGRELDAQLDVRIAAERASPEAKYNRWKRHFFRP